MTTPREGRTRASRDAITGQMVRSLGAPVKSLDKREPNEAEACMPKMISKHHTDNEQGHPDDALHPSLLLLSALNLLHLLLKIL